MYIKVRVVPESKKESVEKIGEDTYLVRVRAKKERNMANKRLLELMSKYFKINPGAVRIVSGHHSQNKIIDLITIN